MQLRNHSDDESSKVVIGEKKVNVNHKEHNLIRKSPNKSTAQDRKNKEDVDERWIQFLPIDMIGTIFLHLPAHFLYNVLRFACRKWHEMINDPFFIRDHFSASTIGALVHTSLSYDPQLRTVAEYFEMRKEGKPINSHLDQERKRKRKIKPLVREGETILTKQELGHKTIFQCCDGLILLMNSVFATWWTTYHIVNPTTKDCMIVEPPLGPQKTTSYNVAIARASAGSEYKLVVAYSKLPCFTTPEFQVFLLTIGGPKYSWRMLDPVPRPFEKFEMLTSGKYVYWYDDKLAMVLDAETETLHHVVNWPSRRDGKECIIESESFIVLACKRNDFGWEFHGLTEPGKNGGEWTKLFDLQFLNKLSEVGVKEEYGESAMPVLALLQANVVVFSVKYCRSFVGYNFKTGHIFKFGRRTAGLTVSAFVPSLVPVSGPSSFENQ